MDDETLPLSENTDPQAAPPVESVPAAPPPSPPPSNLSTEMDTAVAGIVEHVKAWHLGVIDVNSVEEAEAKAMEFINHLATFFRGLSAKL